MLECCIKWVVVSIEKSSATVCPNSEGSTGQLSYSKLYYAHLRRVKKQAHTVFFWDYFPFSQDKMYNAMSEIVHNALTLYTTWPFSKRLLLLLHDFNKPTIITILRLSKQLLFFVLFPCPWHAACYVVWSKMVSWILIKKNIYWFLKYCHCQRDWKL